MRFFYTAFNTMLRNVSKDLACKFCLLGLHSLMPSCSLPHCHSSNSVHYYSGCSIQIFSEVQEHVFNDALVVLKDYLEAISINKEVLSGMSNCMFRLVHRLVQFTCIRTSLEHERKIELGTLLKLLFHCLMLPDYNRYARFKMDMYGAILCIIEACSEPAANENRLAIENYIETGSIKQQQQGPTQYTDAADGRLHNAVLHPCENSLASLLNRQTIVVQKWTSIFDEYSVGVVRTCVSDTEFAPFSQKILAMTCLSEVLREGRRLNNEILQQIRQLGLINIVFDSFDSKICVGDEFRDNKSPLVYLRTFLVRRRFNAFKLSI